MMGVIKAILLAFLPLAHYASGSFYNNPEVVPADPGTTSTIEQTAKWDFDVSQQPAFCVFFFAISKRIYSGLSQAYLPSLISSISNV